MKQRIAEVEQEIQMVGSEQRRKQLTKHKHRLEKEVMKYMFLRYGIKMRKESKKERLEKDRKLWLMNKI